MTITCECDKCKKLSTPGEMYTLQTRQFRELEIDLVFDICSKCRQELINWIENVSSDS